MKCSCKVNSYQKAIIKQPEKESGCLVSLESVHGCRNGYTFERHSPPVELMEGVEIETLGFKMTEEVLYTCLVPAVPFSGHVGLYSVSLEQVGILARGILKFLVAIQ